MRIVGYNIFEDIGLVRLVDPSFYVKKDGTVIAAVWLKGAKYPYVDWTHKIKDFPQVNSWVRIVYHNWAPRIFAYHHVIESFEILPKNCSSKVEADLQ